MLLLGLTAVTESPGCAGAGLLGPHGGNQSPLHPAWSRMRGGAADEREAVPWGHKEGTLLVPEDTNFYCRVSTKASNSRTFFSCTASFSGSESKSSAMDWAPISMERLLS